MTDQDAQNSKSNLEKNSGQKSGPKFVRKRFLTNSKLQFGILFYSICVACIVSIINQVFRFLLVTDLPPIFGLSSMLLLTILNLFLLISIISFGLYFTNRIAGPIYVLQKHMEQNLNGEDVPPFSLRKDDYFTELIVPYNKLIKKIKDSKSSNNT